VLIDGPTDVVVAKFSTWPEAFSDEYFVPTLTGSLDLARQIGGRRRATAAGPG
jgi:hypothetical protein